ncbi:hypothetical protein J6590_007119 [Homalodisca vitripennis]|nr:hypothetical protein J6590_007119 [Homalodisca vitripennis]
MVDEVELLLESATTSKKLASKQQCTMMDEVERAELHTELLNNKPASNQQCKNDERGGKSQIGACRTPKESRRDILFRIISPVDHISSVEEGRGPITNNTTRPKDRLEIKGSRCNVSVVVSSTAWLTAY